MAWQLCAREETRSNEIFPARICYSGNMCSHRIVLHGSLHARMHSFGVRGLARAGEAD
jgi:hypothetical protein